MKLKDLKKKENDKSYLLLDDQDESRAEFTTVGDWKTVLMLFEHAKSNQYQIIISLSLIFLSSLFAIYSSKLMGDLLEYGLIPKNLEKSIMFSVAIIFCEIFSVAFIWLGRKKLAEASSRVIFSVRKSLFVKLQQLPLIYYDRQPQGRIVTRITHDVEGIEEFFTSSLGNLLSASIMTLLAVLAMILSNLKLGLIMTISILPALLLVSRTKEAIKNSNRRVSRFSSAINSKLSEYINGLEVIRSFGLENWSQTKFDKTVDDYLFAQLKGNFLYAWSIPTVGFFATLPLIGLVWYGGLGVLSGAFSLGLFVAFVRYYERFFNPIMLLSREIHVVQQAFTSTERIMNFLKEPDEDLVLLSNGKMKFTHLDGDIKFKNVFMQYVDNEWVLNDLNFHIRSGEKIGLVGKTGCGKTTTVSLLSRLYEFQKGDITIDDIPLRNFDRHDLRSHIGFVSQDAIIFRGTLRDNLSTKNNHNDQELIDSSKKTGLLSALSKEGFNLDMELLEGGLNLSVGQRQLVSLTRVLVSNPSILVLDEATANIDPHYENIIHKAVMEIMKNRTCLIIAHRLDTLKQCDRVFVFNSGRLVESGKLEELIDKGEYFYKLHSAQSIH
jgi:ATP-binding cassette subfamily B multidrug efflux pump